MLLRAVKLPFEGVEILQDVKSQAVSSDIETLYETITAEFSPSYDHAAQNILELGTGSGILAVMVALTYHNWDITAIEVQITLYLLAKRNVQTVNVNVEVELADLKTFGCNKLGKDYDVILCNPPYTKLGSGKISPNLSKLFSRFEILCDMQDVLSTIRWGLKDSGKAFVLYPERRKLELQKYCEIMQLKISKIVLTEYGRNENRVAVYVIENE
jgi:tRNA1(Val) A37 N6-methylase TrmN6